MSSNDQLHSKLKVFLCHASPDKSTVLALYERLLPDGYDPWLDVKKLSPGHDFNFEIKKAIKSSDVVIVCLSQTSTTREGFVQKEIKFALDAADEKPTGTIFVIPARLEECSIPDRLSHLHYVDLGKGDEACDDLYRSLDTRAAAIGVSPRDESLPFRRKYSRQLTLIDFCYDDSPAEHGWVVGCGVGCVPNVEFGHPYGHPFGAVLHFVAGEGNALDYNPTTTGRAVELFVIPEPEFRFYIAALVRDQSRGVSHLWLQFRVGAEPRRINVNEWLLPLPVRDHGDGWSSAFIALPETVSRSEIEQGFVFEKIESFRLRGAGTVAQKVIYK